MNRNVVAAREITLAVPESLAGRRLDQVLAELIGEYSRSFLQGLIRDGRVTVNGSAALQKLKVASGDALVVHVPAVEEEPARAENVALPLLFEDDAIIVVDKPAGLVVHPGAGNRSGTLMNALLNHCRGLFALPRAGIVHRLDKDTSGVMVVAKTEAARQSLIEALGQRRVSRIYRAICLGRLISGGTVDAPIGRHPRNRLKMAVTRAGKPAVSQYRVFERFRAHTDVQVSLETGRTHQIRVHMAYTGHPLVGDPLYGGRLSVPAGMDPLEREELSAFSRQALHARTLSFEHPASGKRLVFEAPLPGDFVALAAALRRDHEKAAPGGAAS
ncbi:MAG: 23S rRNA pseudouridine(1911/1915/1917) synthase RluD [Proteobacteria bacterium]|nr:MAG: 23S rRNA pseudouridine(1911/1915/1917) synthase RluD [Pseudomonadota bacterium]